MKTRIGYKLLRVMKTRPGELFPLYVNADQSIPIGVWLTAECGERLENGKVKSRLGELKFRHGWHINDNVPFVSHIGIKENGKITYMRNDTVWCEVEYDADIDYQLEAVHNGYTNGRFDSRKACLDYIPENGFYKYKTSPMMKGEWIISGNMRILRVLNDNEVYDICKAHGVMPLKRKCEFDYQAYGFASKGA
jgi:hypothetical protein